MLGNIIRTGIRPTTFLKRSFLVYCAPARLEHSSFNTTTTSRKMTTNVNENVSELQVTQMNDVIPTVDENDVALGSASKRACHTLENGTTGILHRAFSVFLFNTGGELLLQRRAPSKITFPNYWTNTCCSHPRYNPEELDETNNRGIKTAAQRRMFYELGVPESRFPLDSMDVLTRVHYEARSCDKWCENEIDYVIFVRGEVDLSALNEDEVCETRYVTLNELKEFMKSADTDPELLFTPWFRFICENFLDKWWHNLESLDNVKDDKIHRAGDQS